MKKSVSVVIPFMNEEHNLPELVRRIIAVFENEPEEIEMIFVDDGSTDGSVRELAALRANDPRIRILELSRNFGHQIAITAGLDHAAGDAVVIIDADLQDPPEAISELLAKWREGSEVVYAVRRRRKGETWIKKSMAACFYRLFRALTKVDVPLSAGDFRLLDRCVVNAIRELREQHRFMRALTSWVGFRQTAVYYDRDPRFADRTKYPLWKSVRLALDAITSFSASPLRWTMGLGFLACSVAMLWVIQMIVSVILFPGKTEPGWASIIVAIVFMGGVQLVAIGVLGQYLGRTFEESKKRPLYFVKQARDKRETETT